jgi:hypothetical protein
LLFFDATEYCLLATACSPETKASSSLLKVLDALGLANALRNSGKLSSTSRSQSDVTNSRGAVSNTLPWRFFCCGVGPEGNSEKEGEEDV